ncbi:PRC-barrel domain-containing protein [Candidatus Parcubacteria bacterium]|nr:PRC-barrel domain-containing protein [Candidatus Parcubacteria bacterium]
MPIIQGKKIIGMAVQTESGEHLGKVYDFEFDVDFHSIIKYYVKASLIKDLFDNKLIIHRDQVVLIDNDKMIVGDGTIKKKIKKGAELPAPI